MTPQDIFIQQMVNGISLGMIYALIALGYTMVYGIIRLINFAHGEVFMVGAYLGLTAVTLFGTGASAAGAAFLAAMAGCALLGVIIEKFAYRPLRMAPRLAPLITAIGISFFLQNAVMLICGPSDKSFPQVLPSGRIHIGGATITYMQLLISIVAVTFMGFLHIFIMRSRLGKAFRATSQDMKAAALMGIDTNRIISLSFLIGSSLGAAGGVLFGMYYNTINFHDGYMAGLKAFTAAVLGGIGNIPGAMLGGLLIGVAEGLGAGYISSQWKNAFAFAILILLLLFKPTGLLGEKLSERS